MDTITSEERATRDALDAATVAYDLVRLSTVKGGLVVEVNRHLVTVWGDGTTLNWSNVHVYQLDTGWTHFVDIASR